MEDTVTQPVVDTTQLPDDVLEYISGFGPLDALESLLDATGLDVDEVKVLQTIDRIVRGQVNMDELPALVGAAGVPEDQQKTFAADLAEQVLLPIASTVGDVAGVVRSWRGEPAIKKTEEKAVPPLEMKGKDLLNSADTAELQRHAEKAKQAETMVPPAHRGLSDVVAEVVAAAGLKEADANTRLANIVEARLRDVRDAYGTRAELEKPVAAGGLGLSGRAVVDLMERIEGAVDRTVRESRAKIDEDRRALVEKRMVQSATEMEAHKKEEQLLARRYAELTGRVPTETIGARAVRTSAALSVEQSVAQAAGRIDTDRVKQVVARNAPTPPNLPSGRGGTVPRPRMEDVRPVQRLASPTDELRLMSLIDFRRLSKDPNAAVEKIMDKIDLLEKEGYSERLAAVKAWRDSALNRWYVSSVQEALSRGLTVDDLLKEKRAAGADVPTDVELQAIVGLNARLRF